MSRLSIVLALIAMTCGAFSAEGAAPVKAAAMPYPLATCIVADEPLGSMGEPVVMEKDGQEVKFCCKGCVRSFERDPAPFMKKIADAEAAGNKAAADGKAPAKK